MGALSWKAVVSDNFVETFPILFAMHVIFLYGILRLSMYKIIFYEDRLVKILWHRKQAVIFYDNIDLLMINAAAFDPYQIAKAVDFQKNKLRKYQIFDITIQSKAQLIYFKTKWFNSVEQAAEVLSLLKEKCVTCSIKKESYSRKEQLKELKLVFKLMTIFLVLSFLGHWIIELFVKL